MEDADKNTHRPVRYPSPRVSARRIRWQWRCTLAEWSLTVRSTYLATPEQVWNAKTDPASLLREFSPYFTLTVANPHRLAQAMRGDAPQKFDARLGGPLGLLTIPWPMRIDSSTPIMSYQDSSKNLLYSAFHHTHRIQPSGKHRVCYTDEVVFTPRMRPSLFTAHTTRALFLHRHVQAAKELHLDEVEGTRAWLNRATTIVEVAVA